MGAYEAWSGTRDVVARLCRSLAVKEEQVQERVAALQDEIKKLNKDIKKAKQSAPSFSPEQLIAGAEEIDGIQVICARIDGADADTLRQTADLLRDRLPRLVCFLGSAEGDKVSIVAAVSKSETKRLQAGAIIKQVAAIVGGGGGGRPDLAQAGGKLPEKLDEAVKQAKELVREILEG
jgi:alanyl-tRNA synthetase